MQKNKLVSRKKKTNSKRKVVSKKRTYSKRKVVSKKRTNSKRKTNSKKRTNSKRKVVSKKRTLSKRKIKRGGEGELTIEKIDKVLEKNGVECYNNSKCSVEEIKQTLGIQNDNDIIGKYKKVKNIIVGPYLDLSNKNLSGADLTQTDLTGAILSRANLTNVKSRDIKGKPKSLPIGYKIVKGYLVGPSVNLTGADLSNADLTNVYLFDADLRSANLTGANLTESKISGANLTGADLSGVKFKDAKIGEEYNQNLTYINIKNADFTEAKWLNEVDFIGSDLTGANFNGATLTYIDFRRTKGVNLTGAKLFAKIDLREAKDYNLGNNKPFKKTDKKSYYIILTPKKRSCHDYDDDKDFCNSYEAKGHECIWDDDIDKCRMKREKNTKNTKTKLPIPIYNRPISVQNVRKTIMNEASGVAATVL